MKKVCLACIVVVLLTLTALPVFAQESEVRNLSDAQLRELYEVVKYERYVDRYVAFMKSYNANTSDINLLLQYAQMLAELAEYSEAADRWDAKQSEMSAADWSYYTTVMLRINNKLLTAY